MAENISFIGGLRIWRHDHQGTAARWILKMQRVSAYVISKRQRLLLIAHAHRYGLIRVGPVRPGRDHQIKLFRQRMGVLNFHLVAQLRV